MAQLDEVNKEFKYGQRVEEIEEEDEPVHSDV